MDFATVKIKRSESMLETSKYSRLFIFCPSRSSHLYPVVRSSALSSDKFSSISAMLTFLRQAFFPLREVFRLRPLPVGAGFSVAVDITKDDNEGGRDGEFRKS